MNDANPSQPEVHVLPIAVPRLDASALLGMSPDSFDRYVRPEIAVIRRGRMLLYRVDDLAAWAKSAAAMVFEG